ncbi:MAG: META domain-containing protein [Anaerolineae bacterium]|jgi:heat shock protein HslJ
MNPDDLVSTAWQLASMDGSRLIEGSAITLAFHDEYRVSGSAGCRGYVATYQASGDDMSFQWMAMMSPAPQGQTAHPCPQALMEQERHFLDHFDRMANYRLDEGQLEILNARSEVLVFEPLPDEANASLEGTAGTVAAFIKEESESRSPSPQERASAALARSPSCRIIGHWSRRHA